MTRPAGPYAALVAAHGLSPAHALLLAAVPAAGARVLDVGCATGYLAAELEAGGAAVTGVEADPAAAAAARRGGLAVVEGDVEAPATLAEAGARGPFDAIVCGDVLEHLRAPDRVLAGLTGLLAPGGRIVASLPNIAHWTARRALLRGRFPQDDHGLFDRTHLRFFTRRTARDLAARAGLEVAGERFAPAPLPLQSRLPALGRLAAPAARRRPELFALQIVLVLVPRGYAG
jgi:2-polyprenyl-3-methyl-5-hydroxy-6-metoxy-1,4-benzoquinol methylase